MAGNVDYLPEYKQFFVDFALTVNPEDQLPVKVAGYCLREPELLGEIVDWILQYLSQKRCPSSLVTHLTKIVIGEIRQTIKKQPIACGFSREDNVYQPLKLMQAVTAKVNEVCLRYHDDDSIKTLPPPASNLLSSVCAIKNTRRRMEDRHTIIEDFHSVFSVDDPSCVTYYGIFDGHAGTDAAVYGVSHLHQFLAESAAYPSDPVRALHDAFLKTDKLFLDKSDRENLRSGTTALCALLNRSSRMLYLAWVGDSQAAIVRRGVAEQLVLPHKPEREDERLRIEEMGGCVMHWGTWRVNGQLAVSRAIGDFEYKPYVSAEPDILAIPVEDNQDFLIIGCDGLWDNVSEQEGAISVYNTIREHPGDLDAVSQSLVQLAKLQGSVDNISVIVVFLTDPAKLAALDVWPSHETNPITMDSTFDNTPFQTNGGEPQTNGSEPSYLKGSLLLDLDAGAEKYKQNVTTDSPTATDLFFLNRPAANGKEETCYDDDDFGPETDVDAVDDVLLSPAIAAAKVAAAFEADLALQKQQLSTFDVAMEPRDETPTPPADHVADDEVLVPQLPEADNVGESGEDSEDEWNYYKVEPTEKKEEPVVKTDPQEVPEKAEGEEEQEDDDNMESRLNPNAAEFVPSPTSLMPSMEELLAGSPRKGGISMEDVTVPSPVEFEHEVSMRPAEVDANDPFAISEEMSYNSASVPDFLNGHNAFGNQSFEDKSKDFEQKSQFEAEFGEFREPLNPFKTVDHLFDKSEVSSTHAEYGDDTTTSFMTTLSETSENLQKVSDEFNASMVEADFQAASFYEEVAPSKNSVDFLGSDILQDDQEENTIPISMEFQSEFSPSAETKHDEMMDQNEDYLSEINSTPFNMPQQIQEDVPVMLHSDTGISNPFNTVADDFSASFNLPEMSAPLNLQLDPEAPDFSSQLSPAEVISPPITPVSMPTEANNTSADMFADLVTDFEPTPSTIDLTPNVEPDLMPGNDLLSDLTDDLPEIMSDTNVKTSVPDIVQESSITNGIQHLELDEDVINPVQSTFSDETSFVNVASTISHTQESSLEEFESHVSDKNNFNEYLNGPSAEVVEDPATLAPPLDAESEVLQDTVIEADVEILPDAVSEAPAEITVAAVAATALAATAVIAGTAAAVQGKPNKDDKLQKAVKKTTTVDKTKPVAGTRTAVKAPLKSSSTKAPTSPPPMAAPRSSSTPKKPAAPTPTRVASKAPATSATKVGAPAPSGVTVRAKLGAPTTKSAAPSKPITSKTTTTTTTITAARPRPAAATAAKLAPEKKPALTNGSAKPPIKRTEPLAVKKLVPTTTSKPLTRPASAPVAVKSTVTRTATTTITKTAPKPAVNGVSKPKPAAVPSTLTARPKTATATSRTGLVDKQGKEMANKQISQTVTSKTSTVTRRAVPGVTTKTSTLKTTTTTTANKSGPIRRPAGTAVTKTTTTKTVDGEVVKSEEVVVEDATTVTKDDSPIVDNAQPMVIASAD